MIKRERLRDIVADLESGSRSGMTPFNGLTKLQCPWIHWSIKRRGNDNSDFDLKSVLLLQDWDAAKQTLDEAVGYLEDCANGNFGARDNTIKNLFSNKRSWKEGIMDGRILVTNAAWGVRPCSAKGSPMGMCGYLGAKIHKSSFLTWGMLISSLLKEHKELGDDFRLFVAGEWATFDDLKAVAEVDLKDYMDRWCSWVTSHLGKVSEEKIQPILDLKGYWRGKVVFLRHPCVWHSSIQFETSPF